MQESPLDLVGRKRCVASVWHRTTLPKTRRHFAGFAGRHFGKLMPYRISLKCRDAYTRLGYWVRPDLRRSRKHFLLCRIDRFLLLLSGLVRRGCAAFRCIEDGVVVDAGMGFK